jgi:hypothetical protein
MITGVKPQKLTPSNMVIPFFILSALSYLALTVLIYFSADSFSQHYFHPKLLAITHVATLGFITSVIIGSLYQMFPVLFETGIKNESLGKLSFYALMLGLIFLTHSFWVFNIGYTLHIGGCLTVLSLILFSYVFYSSIRACKNWKIEFDFISTSVFWLLLTGLVGLLLVFNFSYPFIPKSHLEILKIHAHMGLVGWILLLIIGVSSRLVPMFIIAKGQNTTILKYSYYFINIGLVLFCLAVYFTLANALIYFSIFLIEAGVAIFLYFMYLAFKERIRKKLDTGLKLTFISFLLLVTVLPLAMIVPSAVLPEKNMMMLRVIYGAMILLGFSGSLILGQTLKVVPFILWMYRFQQFSGTKKIPLPKDMVSEKLSKIVMYFFLAGLLILLVSLSFDNIAGNKVASIMLIISAILFNINIAKALFYKIK